MSQLFSSPFKIALWAVGTGVALMLVLLSIDFEHLWPGYALGALAVYGWAGSAALTGARYRWMMGWVLIVGMLPVLLWTVTLVLGVGDPTPLIPFFLYSWAIVSAFRRRSDPLRPPT